MKRTVIVYVLAAVCFVSPGAKAMFVRYETQRVPIERMFTNLQQRLAQNTNNFELTYDLARLHAMAYATNLVSVSVSTNDNRPQFYSPGSDRGVPSNVYMPRSPADRANALRHLTNAMQLYQRAIVLLKNSTNTVSKEWLVLPLELGYAWCLDQAGSRKAALAAYRRVLALAWKKEVTGDFSFKEWVQETWEAVKSGSNPLRIKKHGYIGPGVCYSEEIIGYMLKLLDPTKDADQVAELREKQNALNSMGRAVTPILVPLADRAELSELVNADAGIAFDLDGSGLSRHWGWITPKAAWLVFDPHGQGQITSALQMFGNCTFWIFWRDGYEALRSLDNDHNGVLQGSELDGIALWHDRNCNGISEPGEVMPVADFGITAISCASETDSNSVTWCPHGVTFANGKVRPTYDWIAPSRPTQE
jgi:tetratricopeptide (TPR) repeat protein